MKKISNITGAILYWLLTLTGITFIGNKLIDFWQSLKVRTDLPENENNFIKKAIEKTTYPDDYDPEEFNKWAEYIHKQRN